MKVLNFIFALTLSLITFQLNAQQSVVPEALRSQTNLENQNMYVIERDIPNVGSWSMADLTGASKKSCSVLDTMGSDITWLHSYVTGDKLYCVYLAKNKDLVKAHAEKGGFPCNTISEVATVIDPSTASALDTAIKGR
ncbi:DUF4242 domain-containing protein [Pseudotamlana agarivorans]|uniref:DUF4242 domain-containing protein n=1 Tax=Pseudotamlana agarivorans TaxID=481183 RepID=UPI0009FBAC2C|nr:DUF4242 domain-containing protein [Tamlana agarivorans]